MKKILDAIFKLPPKEDRPNIWQGLHAPFAKISPVIRVSSQHDDLYIYHQSYLCYLVFTVPLALMMLLTFIAKTTIDFGFVTFVYDYSNVETGPLGGLIKQYCEYVFKVVMFFIYPFFLVKYLWNINPFTFDVLAQNPKWQGRKRHRAIIIPLALFNMTVVFFMLKYAYLIAQGMGIRLFFSQSLFSAVFFLLILLFVFSLSTTVLIQASMMLVRYLGPYKGN